MPRILLVKTSSLGDVVHGLPAVSDIAVSCPGAEIDWVVEESFVPVAALHPALRRTLPVAVRRWRTSPWKSDTHREVADFAAALGAYRYDAIIDAQGLFKSAAITRLARGKRFGFDWRSAREPLALFYDRTFNVPRSLHAVERNRRLAALALGYELPARVSYGISASHDVFPWLSNAPYCVLLHATSASRKLWSEGYWVEVAHRLTSDGLRCVLPWGSDDEQDRSERLASLIEGAVVPPRLGLGHVASLLKAAECVVGVDTGLSHLACALGVPTVAIYVDTDPSLTGLYGGPHARNLGGKSARPTPDDVTQALASVRA